MNQFGYFINVRFAYNNAKQKKQRRLISEENEKVFYLERRALYYEK